jgi:hypothetical protein
MFRSNPALSATLLVVPAAILAQTAANQPNRNGVSGNQDQGYLLRQIERRRRITARMGNPPPSMRNRSCKCLREQHRSGWLCAIKRPTGPERWKCLCH